MKAWERIFDDLKVLGYSVGYVRIIEAFIGELWMVNASKNGHRWVIKAARWPRVSWAAPRTDRALQTTPA